MSYFSNNKLYDYYEVNKFNVGSGYIQEPTIEILNNEEILFDFSALDVRASSIGILNYSDVETTKIHIDWGDGNVDRISKPLISNKSTIGTYKPNQWKVIKHLFNVEKRYQYKTDDTKYLPKIKITAYNSIDDRFVIEIPYKILYKTLYDIGSEISLFSANTTNTNKVSYTLKQKNSDSLIVLNSLDWRTIYGTDEIEYVEETVSDVFSNEFVNEDMMVWDWNSAPEIKFKTSSDIINRTINVTFDASGIPIESWYPQLILLRDEGNVSVKVDKNEDNTYGYIAKFENQTSGDVVTDTNFKKGIYKTYLNPLTGVNGVITKSEESFINYGMNNILPRQLCKQDDSDFCSVNEKTHDIVFKYKLPTNHQFCTLTKADLILEAYYTSGNHKGQKVDDVFFTFDLMNSFYDENKKPNFDENKNISYTIRMCDIPDKVLVGEQQYESIKYVPSVLTNDVVDTVVNDNTNIYSESIQNGITKLTPISLGDITFSYDVGNFTDGSLSIKNDTNSKINEKNSVVSWKFTPTDTKDWDQFQFVLTEISTGKIINNDVHEYNPNINGFQGLIESKNGDEYTFKKILDGNKLPDGELKCDVIYKIIMNNYYDSRSASISTTTNYSYATPDIEITNIQPYVKINYDRIGNVQSLILCHSVTGISPKDTIKNIKLIEKYDDNETIVDVSSLNYTYSNVPISKNNLKYTFKAVNENDLYERYGSSSEVTYTNSLTSDDILKLPHNGVDYLQGNDNTIFSVPSGTIDNDEEIPVSWRWVKENTLFDIDKFYKFTDENGKTYYGHEDCGKFNFNDKTRYIVYDIVEVKQNDEIHRRFRPILFENPPSLDRSELPPQSGNFPPPSESESGKKIINITSSRIYDASNDCGKLLADWRNSNFDKNLVKKLTLKLYDANDEHVEKLLQTVQVKGQTSYTFENLDFGKYKTELILDSEEVRTETNGVKSDVENVMIKPTEAISFLGQPMISTPFAGTHAYITWKWNLKHKKCTDVKLVYEASSGESGTISNVKTQSYGQSISIPVKEKDGITNTTVKYYFEITSPYFIDDDGNQLNTPQRILVDYIELY